MGDPFSLSFSLPFSLFLQKKGQTKKGTGYFLIKSCLSPFFALILTNTIQKEEMYLYRKTKLREERSPRYHPLDMI